MSNNMSYDTKIGCGVLILIIGAILLSTTISWLSGGIEYSTGYREGTIQKFSYKGLIFKTNEGELAMNGFKKTDESLGNVFEFTVLDESIKKTIEEVHGTDQVRLFYTQYLFSPFYKGSTGYRITKVERINVKSVSNPPESQ
jgi:hypothetical protein